MRMAESWLVANGYVYRDVHKKSSFDFLATRDGKSFVVEVKGTTGAPGAILLTRNEVELHRLKQPENILIIVHNIELSEDGFICYGGTILSFSPWLINDANLMPLSYQYRFS